MAVGSMLHLPFTLVAAGSAYFSALEHTCQVLCCSLSLLQGSLYCGQISACFPGMCVGMEVIWEWHSAGITIILSLFIFFSNPSAILKTVFSNSLRILFNKHLINKLLVLLLSHQELDMLSKCSTTDVHIWPLYLFFERGSC